jgi:hypothetical protein
MSVIRGVRLKRGRLTAAVIAAISVPGLGLGLGLGAGALTPAAQASSQTSSAGAVFARHFSEKPVVIDCQGRPRVQPGKFTLTCADGNDYLTGLSWTSWTAGLASATSVQEVNDCLPYCAAGHFHGYPVDVIFWGGASVPGRPGTQRYTSVTLLYPGARPNVGAHRGPATITLPLLAAPS